MIAELDHAMDPSTAIAALAKINITTMESVLHVLSFFLRIHNAEIKVFSQLSDSLLKDLKKTMNGAGNVNIAPIHVVEEVSRTMFIFFFSEFSLCQKRRGVENALKKMAQDEDWDASGRQFIDIDCITLG